MVTYSNFKKIMNHPPDVEFYHESPTCWVCGLGIHVLLFRKSKVRLKWKVLFVQPSALLWKQIGFRSRWYCSRCIHESPSTGALHNLEQENLEF